MKPEELQAIASGLGLQFDEESGSIYGVQSGYLLLLHETDVKNQFRLSVSVSLNGNLRIQKKTSWCGMTLRANHFQTCQPYLLTSTLYLLLSRVRCANQRQLKSYRHL